jgi:diguanylate cyclase (GGDEF)-like protein
MRRWLSPKLQLSLGLASLTISLVFIAASFGLLPNEDKAEIQQRGTTATALAVQLAVLASRNDPDAIKETIDAVVVRSPSILSIAIRDANGRILAGSEQHELHWREPPGGKSTTSHVQVPLLSEQTPVGRIEITFRRAVDSESPIGLVRTLFVFVTFMAGAGLTGYYFVLGRALRELDPSRTIPQRVETAFNALAEGVLIIDEKERVLLANKAFSNKILKSGPVELGFRASELPWLAPDATLIPADDLAWRTALDEQRPVLGAEMGICDAEGEVHRLLVNATCIADARGRPRGAIVTFDDVTALQQTNERLSASVEELRKAQLHISDQNRTLRHLASCDSLTGCLNRRTFVEQAEALLAEALASRRPFAFMMIDADHFKSINDRFGHQAGDRVLVGLSDHLRRYCGPPNLVGRYGGEEFCIALIGLSDAAVQHLAEQIRRSVASVTAWLPGNATVTVSIGIATVQDAPAALQELASRADQALYAAKTGGRNRVVLYSTDAAYDRTDRPASQHLSAR